ncbi:zinc finger domain-containing protein [Hirsutella rhossiliensis]|uniref:Zinc finger domain-containing protein n=1 Tax=Hirsutella rhossiliensis TaxID=111463 RepID=A0A9P8MT15_9HYPO|nr:zinc finger domain-containing protein [Hirsutella rhossiliensis]KAH0961463.1 zinc finger domain-containing protein [Hirsutella rhossiliensis]
MTDHLYGQGPRGTDPPRAAFHLRQQSRQSSQKGDQKGDKLLPAIEVDGNQSRRRFPESLHFNPGSFRLRSRTESTRSSISSAHIPDSATTYSVSTLASPLSSSYASDIQERFAAYSIDGPSACSRIRHRHQPSNATTCSTFINDDNEAPLDSALPDFASKIRDLLDDGPQPDEMSETPPVNSPSQESFIKKEEPLSPDEPLEWSYSQRQRQRDSVLTVTRSDTTSVASDDISQDDADTVLDYTLQLAYGIELEDTPTPTDVLRPLVHKFISDLGQHIWQAPSEAHTTQTMLSSSSSTPFQGAGAGGDSSKFYGKRKAQASGDDGGDEFSDGEGSGFGSAKRAKPSPREEDTLRLSCPFRKRNPHRFNVRDHHSCAMTYFPKFAELRQHIVKQHKRDDPSAFICDRCTRDFRTRKELRDHQRQPKEHMCDISDHDPEAGIDGPTAVKLVSRKRASGTSADVQWREIWNILFPDDEDQMIQPYCYTPVIEHFELSAQYLAAFEFLQSSLRSKMSNPTTLETLATKFHQCFIETIESCATVARTMPYTNRSNKKNEPARVRSTHGPNPRKPRVMASRPDSGVVLDDGSEESGSVLGLSALGHRDSVRTVKGLAPRPGSYLASCSAGPGAAMPAPAAPPMIDGPLVGPFSSLPLSVTTGGVDSGAAVRAWNNSVTYDQEHVGLSMPPDQWISAGGLTPHAEFAAMDESLLYQTDFSIMGDSFPSFHDR